MLIKVQVRQVREPSEGFELKHSFYMQETVNWSSKLTFSRERWSRKNARRIGGKHNAVRQADSGFGSRCSRKPRGVSSRPDLAFAFCQAPFLMTFAMGGIPHAGSWHHHSPRQHPNTQRSCPHQPMEILPGSPSLLPF